MALVAPLALLPVQAQNSGQVLAVTAQKAVGKRGAVMEGKLSVQLKSGYHANSNAPNDEYLIPLKLTWDAAPLEVAGIVYPKPHDEKYDFAEKPLSVYTGDFEIATRFKVPKNAPSGLGAVNGKLRYQACTDKMCLPPKTIDVRLTYTIN